MRDGWLSSMYDAMKTCSTRSDWTPNTVAMHLSRAVLNSAQKEPWTSSAILK